jgi:hypothetical protein
LDSISAATRKIYFIILPLLVDVIQLELATFARKIVAKLLPVLFATLFY